MSNLHHKSVDIDTENPIYHTTNPKSVAEIEEFLKLEKHLINHPSTQDLDLLAGKNGNQSSKGKNMIKEKEIKQCNLLGKSSPSNGNLSKKKNNKRKRAISQSKTFTLNGYFESYDSRIKNFTNKKMSKALQQPWNLKKEAKVDKRTPHDIKTTNSVNEYNQYRSNKKSRQREALRASNISTVASALERVTNKKSNTTEEIKRDSSMAKYLLGQVSKKVKKSSIKEIIRSDRYSSAKRLPTSPGKYPNSTTVDGNSKKKKRAVESIKEHFSRQIDTVRITSPFL